MTILSELFGLRKEPAFRAEHCEPNVCAEQKLTLAPETAYAHALDLALDRYTREKGCTAIPEEVAKKIDYMMRTRFGETICHPEGFSFP